jgi:hypothetical protein
MIPHHRIIANKPCRGLKTTVAVSHGNSVQNKGKREGMFKAQWPITVSFTGVTNVPRVRE